jgi:peptidoglycan biosynthesis protein MviN/MurJ (putative lipid II flippase)
VPGRLRTSTKAHLAGAVAAAVYVVAWWWLPDISLQDADKGHNFGWLLLWRFAGVVATYATAAAAVIAVRHLTRTGGRHRDY